MIVKTLIKYQSHIIQYLVPTQIVLRFLKCILLLVEVSIMKSIEYNIILDEIEEFEDLGIKGHREKLGSHALVVIVRGLYKN